MFSSFLAKKSLGKEFVQSLEVIFSFHCSGKFLDGTFRSLEILPLVTPSEKHWFGPYLMHFNVTDLDENTAEGEKKLNL